MLNNLRVMSNHSSNGLNLLRWDNSCFELDTLLLRSSGPNLSSNPEDRTTEALSSFLSETGRLSFHRIPLRRGCTMSLPHGTVPEYLLLDDPRPGAGLTSVSHDVDLRVVLASIQSGGDRGPIADLPLGPVSQLPYITVSTFKDGPIVALAPHNTAL